MAEGVLWESADEPPPRAPLPWIVKPVREDASHGITRDSVVFTLEEARARARVVIAAYREPVLVEEFLTGKELNVGVLGDGRTARGLSVAALHEVKELALRTYRALGLRDYGRVDLRLDADGHPRVLEVNPNPDLSMDAGLAKAALRAGVS